MNEQKTETAKIHPYTGRTFIIDRTTWLRGEGPLKSYLLRDGDSKMCCLGTVALSCGFSKDNILGIRSPSRLGWKEMEEDSFFRSSSNAFSLAVSSMMCVNDNPNKTDVQREEELKNLALQIGFTLEFIN